MVKSGDDAVPGTGLFQIPAPVLEDVILYEGVGIEQQVQPLVGGELAFFVLTLRLAAAQQVAAVLFQLLQRIHKTCSFKGL